jgi:hypothetical protein
MARLVIGSHLRVLTFPAAGVSHAGGVGVWGAWNA